MDIEIKDKFIRLWRKYFNNAELPSTFYYSDKEGRAELVKPGSVARCVIGALVEVRSLFAIYYELKRKKLWYGLWPTLKAPRRGKS